MANLHDIAPRLARARDQHVAYRRAFAKWMLFAQHYGRSVTYVTCNARHTSKGSQKPYNKRRKTKVGKIYVIGTKEIRYGEYRVFADSRDDARRVLLEEGRYERFIERNSTIEEVQYVKETST